MATYLSQSPYDNTIYQNFLQWTQTVGAGLAAIGLKRVLDPGTVNWANYLASGGFAPAIPNNTSPRPVTYRFQGAWVTGTTYTGTATAGSTNDVVTDSGVTYMCVSANGTPFVLTAVANASGGTTVYTGTITGGTTPNYVGHTFVIAGFTNGANNGTFVCTACSTTTLTLANASGVAETHAGTASCKPTQYTTQPATPIWITYPYEIWRTNDQQNATKALSQVAVSGQVVTYTLNGASANYTVGEAVTIAGFANAGNNGTFTVTSVTGTASFTVHLTSQVNETLAATVYNCNFPLYIKVQYGSNGNGASANPNINISIGTVLGTGIAGGLNGAVTGTMFNNSGVPPEFNTVGAGANTNNTAYTDMAFQSSDGGSFSILLWRKPAGATTNETNVYLAIDRARDTAGNPLLAYWTILLNCAAQTNRSQIIFQPGTGGALPSVWSSSWPTISSGGTTWLANGLTPVKPIFPMPGYVGNPVLQAVCLWGADVTEGMLVNAVLYGGSHTYLVSKGGASLNDGLGAGAIGIRWE